MITPLHNDPEKLAEVFHCTYENMAPLFNYKTRPASAVKWEDVPKPNRDLMIAVCTIIQSLLADEDIRVVALKADYMAFMKRREIHEEAEDP